MKRIAALILLLLTFGAASASAQTGGPVTVQGIDPGTSATVTKVGDATNNAVRIRVVASDVASGGTSIADNAAFTQGTTAETPAAGLYATSWTNPTAGHATIFRADINGGIYANIDKVGTSSITLGSKTSANSFPVVVASDQGAIPVSQSGTWTVQPGNTANTTQWLVKSGPFDACGTTTYDPAPLKIPDATLDVLTGTTTCVDTIVVTNIAAASATITIQDTQGTPVELAKTLTIGPNQNVVWNLAGMKFTSGIKYQASTANALNIWVKGRQ